MNIQSSEERILNLKQNIKLINGTAYIDNRFVKTDIYIEKGYFTDKQNLADKDYSVIDASGFCITPGFIDCHIHGAFGADTSDNNKDGIVTMARRLPEFGVAAFCPTTMALHESDIVEVFDSVQIAKDELKDSDFSHSDILGIHLEGPLLNKAKSAAQDETTFLDLIEGKRLIERIDSKYPGLIKIISFAPELAGMDEFIKAFSDKFSLSLAHTDCDYDTASLAIKSGANSVTHLLNAMREMSKRSPNIPAAAMDKDAFVELICDGKHIEAPMLRMLFRVYDENRIVIVSDAMRGLGMMDGEYVLGTTKVLVKNNRTYFGPEGNLAGSVSNLSEEYKVLTDAGIDKVKVIKALTVNPLLRMKICPDEVKLGEIKPGYKGSLNVFNEESILVMSIIDGVIAYKNM